MFIALTLKRAQSRRPHTHMHRPIDSRHEESQDVVVVYRRGEKEIDIINSHFSDVVIQSTLRQGDFHYFSLYYERAAATSFSSNLQKSTL